MPKRCAYGLCRSDTRYPKSLEGEVEFFPFPKPKTQEKKCRAWIKLCGRPHSQLNVDRINKNTYVCSKHFVNRRPTPEDPNPIAALPRLGPRREHQGACRRSPKTSESCDKKPAPQTQQEANYPKDTFHSTSHQSDYAYEEHDMGDHREELRTLQDALAIHKQDIINLKLQLEAKDGQLHRLQKELQLAHTSNALNPETLNQSHRVPDYFTFCTGFSYDQFNSLCEFFYIPTDPSTPQTRIPLSYKRVNNEIKLISLRTQLLLTLMKLRQNLGHKDLAFRFNIHLQSVSTLVNSWVDYMYETLGKLSIWPHRDVISENMPAKFKEEFPNTFAILDCAELKIQRPSSVVLQSQTCSTYRSTSTLKSLVACDPRGAVIYVSALFTGDISDREVFNECNILDTLKRYIQCGHLNVGDGLMLDEGFLIEKEVEEIGLQLNIPPFARANGQMPHADVKMTKRVAKHRVHVERAIAKIKEFKIVSGQIPISQLVNINQIWYVVSMLSNFQPHIKG